MNWNDCMLDQAQRWWGKGGFFDKRLYEQVVKIKSIKMRPKDFNIETTIIELVGTDKLLSDVMPSQMRVADLSEKDLRELEKQLFRCKKCHIWHSTMNFNYGGKCDYCND